MYGQPGSQPMVYPNHQTPPTNVDETLQTYLTQSNSENKSNTLAWGAGSPNPGYATLSHFSFHPSMNKTSTKAAVGSLPSPTGLSTSTVRTAESWDSASLGDLDGSMDRQPGWKSDLSMRRYSYDINPEQDSFSEFYDFKVEEKLAKVKRRMPKTSQERLEHRREQNRNAARKFRQRQKDTSSKYQRSAQQYMNHRNELLAENLKLRLQLAALHPLISQLCDHCGQPRFQSGLSPGCM